MCVDLACAIGQMSGQTSGQMIGQMSGQMSLIHLHKLTTWTVTRLKSCMHGCNRNIIRAFVEQSTHPQQHRDAPKFLVETHVALRL